jgi:N-hydroxyarylamine O-acetyltransferase
MAQARQRAVRDAAEAGRDKETLTSGQVDAYLQRMAAERPAALDAHALCALCDAHLQAVPFENLAVHMREPIDPTDTQRVFDKIVNRNRGGFCYELNGLFGALLEALGYDVTILAGRVYGDGAFGALFDHMALKVVDAEGAAWLVDVGFGRFAGAPLEWASREEQHDKCGYYRIRDVDTGGGSVAPSIDVLRDGKAQYRVELQPRPRFDFGPHCWRHCTAPDSSMMQSLICSRATPNGRVSIAGNRLIVTTHKGVPGREETELQEEHIVAAYKTHFGFELDAPPRVLHPAEDAPVLV